MATTITAAQMLDREFLTIRARLIDVAASLDRIDRSSAAAQVRADPRFTALMQAAGTLADGAVDRTERIQLIFSNAYNDTWRDR